MKKESFIYDYLGFHNTPSKCKIHITKNNKHYICFEEINDNDGTSVTNISEELATRIIGEFKIQPQVVRFFESYKYPGEKRTLDEIIYTWDCNVATNPIWKHIDVDEFNDIFNFDD